MSETTHPDGVGDMAAATGTIVEAARNMGGKLGDAAMQMAETPKAAGADAIEGMGRAVRNAADEIGKESPLVAGYVRDAAASIDKVAGGLRDRTLGDLLEMVTTFGRQQPVAFFAGAIVAGFALSRFVKSGMAERPTDTSPQRNDAAGIGG